MKFLHSLTLSFISFITIASDSTIKLERLHYDKNIESVKLVKIYNKYGDIRIRKTKQDHLTYLAVSQYSDNHKAKLYSTIEDSTLTLEIKYDKPPLTNALERVDVAIIMPGHVTLDIEIEKGNLSSKKIKNKVIAKSQDSNISIKTSNSVNLFSKLGNINLTLIPDKKSKDINLKSHQGNIRINYHTKQPPKVDVISGGVTTTNSIDLLRSQKKQNRTKIYNPKNSFGNASIQTDTGDIQLIEIEKL